MRGFSRNNYYFSDFMYVIKFHAVKIITTESPMIKGRFAPEDIASEAIEK